MTELKIWGGVALGAGALSGATEIAAAARGAWALGTALLLTHPQAVQQANEAIQESLAPGPKLTEARGMALGVTQFEKIGENGFVGTLGNGTQISAGFQSSGGSLGVAISNLQGGSGFVRSLESKSIGLATSEGASSLTITAVNVTNSKLGVLLTKAGYAAQQVTDAFGRTTTNYAKTICTNGCSK